MKHWLRTHIPNLLAGGLLAAIFCAAASQLAGVDPQSFSFDRFALSLVLPALIYLSVFFAAHIGMVTLGLSSRWLYVAAGALAVLVAFGCTAAPKLLSAAQQAGMVTIAVLLPALFGAMLGYLYHRRAGLRVEGDDPAAVAAAAGGADPALLSTGAVEYFGGPLQVRTSAMAIVLAGMGAGLLWAVLSIALMSVLMISSMGPVGMAKAWTSSMSSFATSYSIASVVVGAVLLPIPVFIGHLICRARGWTSIGAYAGVGLVLGLVVAVFGLMPAGIMFAVPSAIGLAFYRYLAGLEPLRLPEDIEVSDRRTLIGADHVRRRYNRIVGS